MGSATEVALPLPEAPGADASVAGRSVFFNHSAFDGNDPAANASDDPAVSPAVAALLPNQSASLSNVSNYYRGLNGVMVDVDHLAADTLSSDDFDFRIGVTAPGVAAPGAASPGAASSGVASSASDGGPDSWPQAPAPASISVRRGAGVNGTDRVTLVWPDGAIRNAWLRVTVLDTSDTGLPAPDVFYFASLPGDAGALGAAAVDAAGGADFTVTRRDLLATRRGVIRRRTADVSSPLDHNHDGRVDARDYVVVRQNLMSRLDRLQAPGRPPVYYVSPSGDDSGDGLGPPSAWRTVAKVNATALPPGSRVLFQRGGEWHERLAVSSSGTPGNPVVFGSYGAGPKPKFWGSDPLDPGRFEFVEGTASTYRILSADAAVVNSVQADHAFLLFAPRAGGNPDPAFNIQYVKDHPLTWYQDAASGFLYVNTFGVDPRDGSVLYTASVRNNVVLVQGRHDVVIRNLVVDESAEYFGGYAFTVIGSDDVTIESSEAYRAGKHHFGVINSGGFVGKGLYAAWAMPLQSFGEASSFVSYADDQYAGKTSAWLDCVSEELAGVVAPTLAFYTHGAGMGDVTIDNMTTRGGIGISIATEGPDQHVRVTNTRVDNARLALNGGNILVDGVTLTGPRAGITIVGSGNVVQNAVIDGALPGGGDGGAVTDYGYDNTFRFSTVRLDPAAPWPAAAIVVATRFGVGPRIYGNVIDAPRAVRINSADVGKLRSDHNLFAGDPQFVLRDGSITNLAGWKAATGLDGSSVAGDPMFADPAAGDLTPRPGSPAVDAFTATSLLQGILFDVTGLPRPQGEAYDLGAFELGLM